MNQNNFSAQREDAIERMREMDKRRHQNESPAESAPSTVNRQNQNSLFAGLNLPFLDRLQTDGDLTLIIGILLLLLSEKADKRLLFALIYILL